MKKDYTVTMPFTGTATRTIEAESKEAAIEIFLSTSNINIASQRNEADAEVLEIQFTEIISQGNFFHGCQNEVEVECFGEEEEEEE